MDDLVTIDRSLEDVFLFVTDQANSKLWKPFVTESRQLSPGPIGVGTRFVEGIHVWHRHLAGIIEITEYEPHSRYAYRTLEEPYPFSLMAQMSFQATASGTSIRGQVHFQGHSPGWHWLTPLVRLVFKSQQRGAFRRLNAVIEKAAT